MRTLPGLLASMATFLACEAGHAVMTGESLIVDPCANGKPRIWQPFRLEMDRLIWDRPVADVGILTLQAGYRDPNRTDLAVMEFRDVDALEARVRVEPGLELPLPDAGRLSLSMNGSCPDAREPLVTRGGRIRLDRFDLSFGGRIAGTAWFDLEDPRNAGDSPPVGVAMTLDFSVDLTEKDPRTGGGRR